MTPEQRIEYFMSEIARLSNQIVDLQDERDALKEQNAALAAQVEALAVNRDAFREAAYKAVSIIQLNNIELPAGYGDECLREIRAEAGRDWYVAGFKRRTALGPLRKMWSDEEIIEFANQYAETIRQEVK